MDQQDSHKGSTGSAKSSIVDILMSSSRRKNTEANTDIHVNKRRKRYMPFQDGLNTFVSHPERCTTGTKAGEVIKFTDQFTLICDKYPKATVHLLVLPRDLKMTKLHPFQAFSRKTSEQTVTGQFYQNVKNFVDESKEVARSMLEQKHNRKFTLGDIKTGVHADPSMANLHIHIISVDNYSDFLKNKKHYNSFNTDFFVPFDALTTISSDIDDRVKLGPANLMQLLNSDLICWQCQENFGNKFKQFKEHLKEEFEKWKVSHELRAE
ncbi:HIT-like domain-containing protein [Dipodascopsis uninucleata]